MYNTYLSKKEKGVSQIAFYGEKKRRTKIRREKKSERIVTFTLLNLTSAKSIYIRGNLIFEYSYTPKNYIIS